MIKTRTKARAASALPDFVSPCLATACKVPPSGPRWVHEIKLDGYRLQARIDKGIVQLLTRRGLDWTHRFWELAKALAALDVHKALMDGEAIVEDERGVSSFTRLVDDLKAGRSQRMAYVGFDLLHLDGVDTARQPLSERKALLAAMLAGRVQGTPLRYSQHFEADGAEMLAGACELGLEGIVSKRLDLPYRSGRREDWLKTKCLATDEFVVGGYLDHAAIKGAIGALALGYYDGDALIYAGRVGTGFSHKLACELWDRMQPLRLKPSLFTKPLDAAQRRGVQWVRPELVAQIGYRAWTGDGLLRHASFISLREDKPARDVGRPAG